MAFVVVLVVVGLTVGVVIGFSVTLGVEAGHEMTAGLVIFPGYHRQFPDVQKQTTGRW